MKRSGQSAHCRIHLNHSIFNQQNIQSNEAYVALYIQYITDIPPICATEIFHRCSQLYHVPLKISGQIKTMNNPRFIPLRKTMSILDLSIWEPPTPARFTPRVVLKSPKDMIGSKNCNVMLLSQNLLSTISLTLKIRD